MDRLHKVYRDASRFIIDNENFNGKTIVRAYEEAALTNGFHDQLLYDEAVALGNKCHQHFNDEAVIDTVSKRMLELPVVYNLIICKQVPTAKLSTVIGFKSFRPLAEELMTAVFGV